MIYFVQIEISGGSKGMFLSQRKYVLDLLKETKMLRCLPAATPIEHNHCFSKDVGTLADKKCYHILVGRLLYLSHTQPDVGYAVSVVSQFMDDPRSSHMNVA